MKFTSLLLVPLLAFTQSALASYDIFLVTSQSGLQGEVQNQQFPNSIEVDELNFGAAVAGAGAKPQYADVVFKKRLDKSSATWLQLTSTAVNVKGPLVFNFVKPDPNTGSGQSVFRKLTLSNLIVTSYAWDDSSSDEVPEETISLRFQTFKDEYYCQSQTGTISGTPCNSYTYTIPKPAARR